MGDFSFIIGEPATFGGEDAGPNPVEFALASLAGCMNVVIHLVAKEQGGELRSLQLSITGELDPSRLLALPTESRSGFGGIELIAELDSDSSTEQLDEILRLADLRCPVSGNLATPLPWSYGSLLRPSWNQPSSSGRSTYAARYRASGRRMSRRT
ncbi:MULTISPECIES: OsmC family protein [Cryobacterium]|uniref:OsmC family peroxiredoxin n=1 Tax=Cryobacterium breve TaxID=1259258 RepID=A0ABY2IUN7_9MICO|nr:MULTISPECIES: OsmC family protein [Cryobacterium]TFC93618.1 OsmC family peroxiredoxin [Cryobacterium sp. TmT3-12]TFC95328.1 OsmC family peroxiredoxin [Cryobacterium breve]